jgi:ABC-type spermidine/putrescine transport system permease subunit II
MLAVVVALGLASRSVRIGWRWWDKSLGDVSYAAAVFLLISVIVPNIRIGLAAGLAIAFCLGIECFKLTGLPRQWDGNPVLRVVFGSTFSWGNIVCYCVGVGAMVGIRVVFD